MHKNEQSGKNNKIKESKRWHEKRIIKECNIGDKMLINNSSKEIFK